MSVISETVKGAIKINSLLDRECFTSWQDFVEALPRLLAVEVPVSISGVIIAKDPPGEDDRDKLWIRRDGAGNIVGFFLFQNGDWNPFYLFAPQQVIWVYGDSRNVAKGFVLIDTGDAEISSNTVAALRAQYVPNLTGGFEYFAVRFVGF